MCIIYYFYKNTTLAVAERAAVDATTTLATTMCTLCFNLKKVTVGKNLNPFEKKSQSI